MRNEALGFALAFAIGLAVAIAVFWGMLSGAELPELVKPETPVAPH